MTGTDAALSALVQALDTTQLAAALVLEEDTIRYANPGARTLFRASGADALSGTVFSKFASDGHRADVRQKLKALRPGGAPEVLAFRALDTRGGVLELEVRSAAIAIDGRVLQVCTLIDVTERRRAETQLRQLAFLDPLTGLANRALFYDRLRQSMAAANRENSSFALLATDLDGFKAINDSLGHDTGDRVLQQVGQRFLACARESDTVARMGGDEFTILLPRIGNPEDAALVAGRLVRSLADPVIVNGVPCQVGTSVGVAVFPEHGRDMDTLVARADTAMYAAKAAGRGRYVYADASASSASPVHLSFVHWNDAHNVGIAEIDIEHRQIVEILNRIGDDLKNGLPMDRIRLSVGELLEFTLAHFAHEERLMRDHRYPAAERHAEEHARLLDDVRSLTINLDQTSLTLTMRYLQEWLFRHVDTMDRTLGRALRAAGVS